MFYNPKSIICRLQLLTFFIILIMFKTTNAQGTLSYAEGGPSVEDPNSLGYPKFYIDSQNGNDSNTGSISSPWKSVSKVSTHAGTATQGTHYLFKRGLVYANAQTDLYSINGADGRRIVFGAYGSLTANKPRLDNIQFYGGTYLMIRDLHCKQIVVRSGTSHTIIYNNEVSGQGKQGIAGFKRVNHISIISNYLHDVAYSQEDVIVLHAESWNAATYEYDIGSHHWIIDNTIMMSGGNEDGIDICSEHGSSYDRAIDFKVIGNRIMAQPNSGVTKNAIQIGHWSEKVWVMGNITGGYTTEDSKRLGPWQDEWKGVTEIARDYQVSGNASFFNGIHGANIRINFDYGRIFHNTLLSPTSNGFKWITSTGVTTADNVTTSSNVPGVSYPNLSDSFNKDPRNWNDIRFLQYFIPDANWSGNNGDATIGAFDSNGKRLGMAIDSFPDFGNGWEGTPLGQQKLLELGISWDGDPVVPPLPVPTPDMRTNLALNKATTASSSDTNIAANAVDGNLETRWSADAYPQWIRVDLGSVALLNKTEMVPYLNRAYTYKVETSLDGTTFTQVVDRADNTTESAFFADSFAPVSARYVRLTVTGCSGSYTGTWSSIAELRVFGLHATSVMPPIFSPTPSVDAHVKGEPGAGVKYYNVQGRMVYRWQRDGNTGRVLIRVPGNVSRYPGILNMILN